MMVKYKILIVKLSQDNLPIIQAFGWILTFSMISHIIGLVLFTTIVRESMPW